MTLHPPPSQEEHWWCFTTHTTQIPAKLPEHRFQRIIQKRDRMITQVTRIQNIKRSFSFSSSKSTPKNADLMKLKTDSDEHNWPCLLLIHIFPTKTSKESSVLAWLYLLFLTSSPKFDLCEIPSWFGSSWAKFELYDIVLNNILFHKNKF